MSDSREDDEKLIKPISPSRRTVTGPRVLTKQTRPGAIKCSMARSNVCIFANPIQNNDDKDKIKHLPSTVLKGSIWIDGPIDILSSIEVGCEVLCCKYTEEYKHIACGVSDGEVSLYQSRTSEFITELADTGLARNIPVTSIKHRSKRDYPINNTITCSYLNGIIKCWNYNFGKCIYTIRQNRQIFGVRYHPRLTKLLTYGDDSRIIQYDEDTQTLERILTLPDNRKSNIYACCCNPGSYFEFITGGSDNFIHFWDIREPYSVRSIPNAHLSGEGLDINCRGTQILACSHQTENAFQIFDYGSGRLLSKMDDQHLPSKLYTGRFATANYAVIGGESPNLFQVVDLNGNLPVATIKNLPTAVHSLDLGEIKPGQHSNQQKSKLSFIPTVVFTSGSKLYEIDVIE